MSDSLKTLLTAISFDSILTVLKKANNILDIVFDSDHYELKEKIASLDITDKLKEIDAFITDIQDININKLGKESISVSLSSLHDVILRVHATLERISKNMLEHKDKYLSTWRSYDAKDSDDLIKYDKILDLRYKRLKDLLSLPWRDLK